MEVILTEQNFKEEVLECGIPVLVDFYADWCGPCKMLAPTVKQIADEYAGKVKVCKVNVDEEPELAMQFGISSIPMLILFRDGKVAKTAVGFRPKEEIVGMFA
jgi:thioredoxin 1